MSQRRHAVTLIEIIVVIAIIALIAALTLPAIMRARTAATRADCSNRLRQIGVALQNYASTYGCFPVRAIVGRPMGGLEPAGPWSQHVALLQYLEQRPIYNAINIALFWESPANQTVGRLSLDAFLCPADPVTEPAEYGFGNYAACLGSGVWLDGPDSPVDPSQPADGIFTGLYGIRPAECPDGLSNTAAFSEIVHGGGQPKWIGGQIPTPPTAGMQYLFRSVSPATQRTLISMCSDLGPNYPQLAGERAGTPWFLNSKVNYTHLMAPNSPRCVGPGFGDVYSALSASSRHSGVVHLMFADGHHAAVTDSVDLGIWRALGSRNGGETIDRAF